MINFSSSLCAWRNARSCVRNTFGSQTLSMVWDFGGMNPFFGRRAITAKRLSSPHSFVEHVSNSASVGPGISRATKTHPALSLPDDSVDVFFTDPPYYDAIPYGHLSGYFSTWLAALGVAGGTFGPEQSELECIVDERLGKDKQYFEVKMQECLEKGRRCTKPDKLGVIVFAHKSTSGWEAQIQAMLDAGWVVTASWPLDTELRGQAPGYRICCARILGPSRLPPQGKPRRFSPHHRYWREGATFSTNFRPVSANGCPDSTPRGLARIFHPPIGRPSISNRRRDIGRSGVASTLGRIPSP